MQGKIALTILALAVGGFILTSPPASAQQDQQHQQKNVQGQSHGGGRNANVAPGNGRRAVAPRGNTRIVSPRVNSQRTFRQRNARTVTPRGAVTERRMRTVTQRETIQRRVRTTTPRVITPRTGPKVVGGDARLATAGRIHGAARTVIRGHNFSVWRSGHRVRHNNGWRTFVAIGSLASIYIGSDDYYPYAYISATRPYCEGLTYDRCELRWQEVETIEGDVIGQCVAYCPR
jgi:hypothetical protein